MTTFHRLSLLACTLAAPLLGSCAQEPPPEVAKAPAPLNTGGKIGVVPQEAVSDSTQKLLEIRQWQFKVNIPSAHKHLLYIFEVREKDKKPRVINRAILEAAERPQRRELALAMLPLNFDWTKSERVKHQFVLGGSTATGEVENPFKGCTAFSLGQAKALSDGSFLLMEGNTPGYSSVMGSGQAQIVLVLKLQSAADVETLLAAG